MATRLLVGLGATFLLLILGIVAWWVIRGSAVEARLAELRAKGLPTTAAEINDFYKVPEGVNDTTSLWVSAITAVKSAGVSSRGRDLPIVGNGPTPVPPPGSPWAEADASRALVESCSGPLSLVHKAADAGGQARYPVDFSLGINVDLTSAQNVREVARLLHLDAHVAAHAGDSARVLNDVNAIFALSDSLRGEPCLISQLVRIAIYHVACKAIEEFLPHVDWNDDDLAFLQNAVRRAKFKEEMARAQAGERAITLTELNQMTLGPFRQSNSELMLTFYGDTLDAYESDWPDLLQQIGQLSDRMRSLAGGRFSRIQYMGVLMLMPAIEQATIAAARASARQRCMNAILAAKRHQLAEGRLPASLSEIPMKLLNPANDARVDPFDGQSLRFLNDETRLVIYSVGINGIDDKGHLDPPDNQAPMDVGAELRKRN